MISAFQLQDGGETSSENHGVSWEMTEQRPDYYTATTSKGIMAGVPVVPPGLENLLQVSELYVKQTWNSTFQSYCTYDLYDPDGHLLYEAIEQQECCGPRLDLMVNNTQGYNVLNLLVPSNFCNWDTELQVSSSTGELLGYIDKTWASFSSAFDISDPSGLIYLKVKGPGWGESFMSDTYYQVISGDKTAQIGVITRVWRGFFKEMFINKDTYIISFPQDLHVTVKAMLVACTLFIDLLNEESRRNQSSQRASS